MLWRGQAEPQRRTLLACERWRSSVKAGQIPAVAPEKLRSVGMIVHIELTAIVVILLMAAMMAKGIGLIG